MTLQDNHGGTVVYGATATVVVVLPPTDPTATENTYSQVLLSWTAPTDAPGVTYTLYRGTASGAETNLASGVKTTILYGRRPPLRPDGLLLRPGRPQRLH